MSWNAQCNVIQKLELGSCESTCNCDATRRLSSGKSSAMAHRNKGNYFIEQHADALTLSKQLCLAHDLDGKPFLRILPVRYVGEPSNSVPRGQTFFTAAFTLPNPPLPTITSKSKDRGSTCPCSGTSCAFVLTRRSRYTVRPNE